MSKHDAPVYTKQQFLGSKRYASAQKDVLSALLKDDETYTTDQVTTLIADFMRKEAK